MRFLIFILLLISSLTSNACSEVSDSKKGVTTTNNLDTLLISSPSPLPNNYRGVRPVYKDKSLVAIAGYNEPNHSVDIRPLDASQDITITKFPLEGPNQVEEVTFFQLVSKDSLIVTDDNYLYIFNAEGKQYNKISLRISPEMPVEGGSSDRHYTYGPYLNIENGLTAFYDKSKDVFYYPIRNRSLYEFFTLDFYSAKDPLVGKLDLRTMEYSFLPITYPDELQQTLYGVLSAPSIFPYEDGVYYGFGHRPDIHHFSFLDGTQVSYQGDISYPKPEPYREGGMPDENAQTAYKFSNIFFDPISGVVMRTYTYPKEMGKRGRLAAYCAFTKEGEFLGEERINCACPFFGLLPNGKGFYTTYMLGDEDVYTLIHFPYEKD